MSSKKSGCRGSSQQVRFLRRMIHRFMEAFGFDERVDPWVVNGRIERLRGQRRIALSDDQANHRLKEMISCRQGFAAGKVGSSECWALCWHLGFRRFYKYTWTAPSFGELDLYEQSGVFPRSAETFHQFAERYLKSLRDFDLVGVWYNPGEDRILSRHAPKAVRIPMRFLEPWFFPKNPWSMALEGKRVLIIHPFEATIRKQFMQREQIWRENPRLLPDFQIRTIKSPFGFSANEFRDWFEMLDHMEAQMERVEQEEGFDIALIGCGAAGVPLAAKARAMGKAGIHMGGALQLLFGIRGQRWDGRKEFQSCFNEYWCRASASETPPEYGVVDQGGYW